MNIISLLLLITTYCQPYANQNGCIKNLMDCMNTGGSQFPETKTIERCFVKAVNTK